MHRANLTIIAIPVLLLAITTVATPSMITEDVFAKYGRYVPAILLVKQRQLAMSV